MRRKESLGDDSLEASQQEGPSRGRDKEVAQLRSSGMDSHGWSEQRTNTTAGRMELSLPGCEDVGEMSRRL